MCSSIMARMLDVHLKRVYFLEDEKGFRASRISDRSPHRLLLNSISFCCQDLRDVPVRYPSLEVQLHDPLLTTPF